MEAEEMERVEGQEGRIRFTAFPPFVFIIF